ncbi:MAG: hypothetical protein H6Q49_1781, partial [Deltaproteobacteria bacterium]|nr:hypothetical protein [Deltaproteobacteria bacterium]
MLDQSNSFILTKDEFKNFLKILSRFSDACNDLHIIDGQVLQRSNDRGVAIRCDLSSLIKFDGEIILCDIKKIVGSLKGLDKNSPIRFIRVGSTICIKDTGSSIYIPIGNNVFIDNKYIPVAEFDKIFNYGQMILEGDMDKNLCEPLKKFAKNSNSYNVILSIKSQKAVFRYGKSGAQSISAEFNFSYRLMPGMPDGEIKLPIIPFDFNSASTLKVYFDQNNNSIALNVFTIQFSVNIAIAIYSRSS